MPEDVCTNHGIQNLEAVHHQPVVIAVVTVALGGGHVVAGLDEVDYRIDSRTVDFRE